MKKTLCMILALLMCGAILATVGAFALAADEADPTDTAPAEYTVDPALVSPDPAPVAPTTAPEPDPAPTPDDAGGISGYEVATVPVLVIICFGDGQCIKPLSLDNKWIPAIMVPVGAVLGFVAFHVMPDFPAGDAVTAIGVGVASGLAATGVHQVYKQMREV